MRKFLTGLLVFIAYACIVLYIGWNGWAWISAAFGLESKWIFIMLLLFFAFSLFVGMAWRKGSIFRSIGYLWFGFFQYALMVLPLANLAYLLVRLAGTDSEPAVIWIGSAAAIALLFVLLLGLYNAYSPIVRHYSFSVEKKAGNRKNLRIVMASDMHFGHLSGKRHMRKLVEMINGLDADIILFPGDIIDDHPAGFIRKKMNEDFLRLDSKLGTYGVLGNHEYYGGAVPAFLEEMDRSKVRILLDESMLIENSFYLVGRKDKTDRNRKPVEALLEGLDKEIPIILMDHQPYGVKDAAAAGVDIMLSGHTHRGQMAPNHLITKRMYELDWGYVVSGTMHLIVSSGFGFWGPPFRLGSRSEIVQIDVEFQ